MVCTIYYVRHGQTDNNLNNIRYGRMDVNINSTGILQAKETAEKLKDIKFDIAFCSPLLRAKETFGYINKFHNLPLKIDERLVERTYGKFEGIKNDILENEKLFNSNDSWDFNKNLEYKDSGVESLKQIYERAIDFIKDISTKYKNKTVLVVAHRGLGRCFRAFLEGIPDSKNISNLGIPNAGYVKFVINEK